MKEENRTTSRSPGLLIIHKPSGNFIIMASVYLTLKDATTRGAKN
jgi:hypothetical protein